MRKKRMKSSIDEPEGYDGNWTNEQAAAEP